MCEVEKDVVQCVPPRRLITPVGWSAARAEREREREREVRTNMAPVEVSARRDLSVCRERGVRVESDSAWGRVAQRVRRLASVWCHGGAEADAQCGIERRRGEVAEVGGSGS
jgi:hypothetical protein